MMNYTLRSLLLGSVLFLTSCATVFTGTKQNVMIKSNPEGATIEVDGFEQGVTPMPVKLR
ncbi:MAG: PEGA domain-containing protein [Sphingobacterium hotanense]